MTTDRELTPATMKQGGRYNWRGQPHQPPLWLAGNKEAARLVASVVTHVPVWGKTTSLAARRLSAHCVTNGKTEVYHRLAFSTVGAHVWWCRSRHLWRATALALRIILAHNDARTT